MNGCLEDYASKLAYLCHVLEHEDHEMMREFQTNLPDMLGEDEETLMWSEHCFSRFL